VLQVATINRAECGSCKTLNRKYTKYNKQHSYMSLFCHAMEVQSADLERLPLSHFSVAR
jgi:hypothetical protein